MPGGDGDERCAHHACHADLDPVDSCHTGPDVASSQQKQRLHAAHFEQRHEREQQRHQHAHADALKHRLGSQAVGHTAERGGNRFRDPRDRHRSNHHADQAAAQSEQDHLHDVGRQYQPGRGAHAFQNRHAFDLLAHEDTRHAPHADAAENHHDEPDEAQVVLRAHEVFTNVVFGGLVGAGVHEIVLEIAAQVPHERVYRIVADAEHDLIAGAAAEGQQSGRAQIVVVDQHACAEAEGTDTPAGLLCDHAANGEALPADDDVVPDTHAELNEKIGPDERAAILKEVVLVGHVIRQDHLAIHRKPALDALQLHHLGHGARRRPHHRGGLH